MKQELVEWCGIIMVCTVMLASSGFLIFIFWDTIRSRP